ncbi:hypothetical protein DRO54_03565 [Candidatus Bathyarchaeota archaeon]|nr:MAG: hypothetical protein DRO54_03565 [Candidatus Bathyarchaeota archaeon]
MNEIEVLIETEVNLTEDVEKVKRAIENIFGTVEYEIKSLHRGKLLVARTKGIAGLTKLYNLLRRERIRDAARAVLFQGADEKSITFYLNKQVAYAGHISFCKPVAESPLGPIKVQIKCENPKELIDWLTPKTTTS